MEEIDSVGISPLLKHWKRKGRDHITSENEGSDAAESDNDLQPLKKLKIMKDTMEPVKKRKNMIHKAITAIQQGPPVSSADNDSQLEASEKREVAAKEIQPRLVVSTDKHLGTGPEWNPQQGRKQGDQSIMNPNKKNTRDLPADSDACYDFVDKLITN